MIEVLLGSCLHLNLPNLPLKLTAALRRDLSRQFHSSYPLSHFPCTQLFPISPTARQKMGTQAGRGGGGGDNDDEDDYDLDDPFLNDSSSDDYAPTDDSSDSGAELSQETQEEDDTRRMLKEAKKFLKKRK